MTDMSERARALEQAAADWLRTTLLTKGHGEEVYTSAVERAVSRVLGSCSGSSLRAQLVGLIEALAVDPPPSGASPQAETSASVRALTVHICEDCLNLRGEMCNEPGCRFCRRTMAEVAEYLDVLLIRPRIDGVSVLVDEGAPLPAPVSPVEPTTCPKCRSNTRAYRLAVADVIDGRMAGMTSCRDEWHSRMPMVSPVEPEPPVGSAVWVQSAGGRRTLGTASSKAVEPEPATTCHCLDCEPLTNPGPKPSEDDIDRLEKAAWDSKTDRVLVWYRDRAEMFRQRLRETERAWQIDRKKPTVEPEPCVWRAIGVDECAPQCGRADDEIFSRYVVQEWQACPYCKSPLQLAGAPLKVER